MGSEASDRCQAEKRKTINGEDILFAMSTLGFDNYVEPLKLYLQKYREAMKGDKHTEGFEDINEVLHVNNQGGGQVLLAYSSDNQQFQLQRSALLPHFSQGDNLQVTTRIDGR